MRCYSRALSNPSQRLILHTVGGIAAQAIMLNAVKFRSKRLKNLCVCKVAGAAAGADSAPSLPDCVRLLQGSPGTLRPGNAQQRSARSGRERDRHRHRHGGGQALALSIQQRTMGRWVGSAAGHSSGAVAEDRSAWAAQLVGGNAWVAWVHVWMGRRPIRREGEAVQLDLRRSARRQVPPFRRQTG